MARTHMLMSTLLTQLKNYDEIIFDLDNTLFSQCDYDKGAFEDIENALTELTQLPLLGFTQFLSQHKQKMGNNYGFLFNDALTRYQLSIAYLSVVLDKYYQHNGRYINPINSLVPHINKTFTNKKIFIVTNGPTKVQQTKIKKLSLNVTDIIICDPKYPDTLKPKSYAYDILTKKHSLANPVMVGDSLETDGLFAKNVNIPFIHFIYDVNADENS